MCMLLCHIKPLHSVLQSMHLICVCELVLVYSRIHSLFFLLIGQSLNYNQID